MQEMDVVVVELLASRIIHRLSK